MFMLCVLVSMYDWRRGRQQLNGVWYIVCTNVIMDVIFSESKQNTIMDDKKRKTLTHS